MPQVDSISNAPVVIDTYHQRIHEGSAWKWTQTYSAIADNAVRDSLIITHGAIHVVPKMSVAGEAIIEFHEVASYTNGTSKAPVNRNLFKTHVASVSFHAAASMNVSSRTLFVGQAGGVGGFFIPSAGGDTNFPEFILPGGRVYSLRFTNVSGGASDFTAAFDFYETGNAG